jgi:hypothetical protein
VFHPAQPQFQPKAQVAGQGFSTPQCQVIQRPNNFQTPTTGNQSVQRTQATQNLLQGERKCYACGERGHFANQCPNPSANPPQTVVSTPAPTCGANSILVDAKQNYAQGRVNHVIAEEANEAPDVVIYMFFVNDTSTIVLFDSGVSHSFISAMYVEKHNLPTQPLRPKVNLKIRGVDFVANLIVLESKGINIILGMDWLSKHKVLINCTKKSIRLTTPDGKELEFVVELVVTTKGAANRAKVN